MSRILFQNFDLSCLNIVGVADSKYTHNSTESFWGHKTINPLELKDFDFDVILIAVKEKKKILENIKYTNLTGSRFKELLYQLVFKICMKNVSDENINYKSMVIREFKERLYPKKEQEVFKKLYETTKQKLDFLKTIKH